MYKGKTVGELVSRYVLMHDLKETTADQYHKIVGVWCSWAGGDIHLPAKQFTALSVSKFLAAKQQLGLSSHYRRSLRNCLIALLRFAGLDDDVRPVRVRPLTPEAWRAGDISKLVRTVNVLPEESRHYFRTIILAAWYTGMSQDDLHSLLREQIEESGRVTYVRGKTNKLVITWMPLDLVGELPEGEQPWPLTTSREYFRRQFNRVVEAAALEGTFKKLRKSCGTAIDLAAPGTGHVHLGNTRRVFELHYLDQSHIASQPRLPPKVP